MIVRGIVYAIAIIISFLLQTSVFSFLKLADTTPNVMLALVVCIAMIRGRKEGVVVGFFCGLCIDLLYGTNIGIYALLYVVIGYVNGFFQKMYFQDDFMLPLAVLTGNSLIYDILIYVLFFLMRGRLGFFYFMWKIIIPEAIYTAVIALIVYRLLLPILDKIEEYEERGTI